MNKSSDTSLLVVVGVIIVSSIGVITYGKIEGKRPPKTECHDSVSSRRIDYPESEVKCDVGAIPTHYGISGNEMIVVCACKERDKPLSPDRAGSIDSTPWNYRWFDFYDSQGGN